MNNFENLHKVTDNIIYQTGPESLNNRSAQYLTEYEIDIPTDIIRLKQSEYPPWQIPTVKSELELKKFPKNTPSEEIRFRFNELIS